MAVTGYRTPSGGGRPGSDGFWSPAPARDRSWDSCRCHEQHVDDFKPKSGDPLHEPGEGSHVGQLGAEGSRVRAGGDLAVVELCAQRSVGLADKGDLVCAWWHWDCSSQLVVDTGCQRAWRRGTRRHPILGDPGFAAITAVGPGRVRTAAS